MSKKYIIFLFPLVLVLGGDAFASPQKYNLEPKESKIAFHGHSRGHHFDGVSQMASGAIDVDLETQSFLGGGRIQIPIKDFVTGNLSRDHSMQHMFEMDKFPVIYFEVRGITRVAEGLYRLQGDLKMHNVERPVEMDVKASFGDGVMTVEGRQKVSIVAFGMKAPSILGYFKVDDEVDVEFRSVWKKVT